MEFYRELADGETVMEAFDKAVLGVEKKSSEVWQGTNERSIKDLSITPVLLPSDSESHDQKLFEDTEEETKVQRFSGQTEEKNELYDTSKARGQLIGLTNENPRYFGRKLTLYKALESLSNPLND